MIVVKSARVLGRDGLIESDVGITDDLVTAVGTLDIPGSARVIDGTGFVLGPGFVDLHVHFRDPGETWKEDISSGTAAAAAGGFTAVVVMPNTSPPIDSADVARRITSVRAPIELVVAGTLTMGRKGKEMAHLDDLYDAGVRIFTDDGNTVTDAGLFRNIMSYMSDRDDIVIAQHAEDPDLAGNGQINDGKVARLLGIPGLPAAAEEVIIARDLVLVAEMGVRYHVQHVSTAGSVELIRRAKDAGLRVTAEVTPHHLALTEDDASGLNASFKMYPPLRTSADRQSLVEALSEGVIDVVATDHAPHTPEEKDVPYEQAPRGVIGLETAFGAVCAALNGDIERLFDRMSVAPARIAGLPNQGQLIEEGSPANLVLVDPTQTWTVDQFESRSSNSPFVGTEMKGKVIATICRGEIVFGDKP